MDESAVMVMLQMAAEEVDAGELNYRELRDLTEKKLMVNHTEVEQGGDEKGETVEKDAETGLITEDKEGPESLDKEKLREEDWVGSGLALANDFKLCIRPKQRDGEQLSVGL